MSDFPEGDDDDRCPPRPDPDRDQDAVSSDAKDRAGTLILAAGDVLESGGASQADFVKLLLRLAVEQIRYALPGHDAPAWSAHAHAMLDDALMVE